MRCLVCEALSTVHVCRACQARLIVPQYTKRTVEDLDVYSFFSYDEIDILLTTKHTYVGHYIFNILAAHTFKTLAQGFNPKHSMAVVPVDDHIKHGYSHTAILAHALASSQLIPSYKALHATNRTAYAGKSLAYRKAHPRNFVYKPTRYEEVILVDDIVTTGSTLLQAKAAIEQANQRVAFAVVLADAAL